MTTVWLLTRGIRYEGEEVLGVYCSFDAAKAAVPTGIWEDDGEGGITRWESDGWHSIASYEVRP